MIKFETKQLTTFLPLFFVKKVKEIAKGKKNNKIEDKRVATV